MLDNQDLIFYAGMVAGTVILYFVVLYLFHDPPRKPEMIRSFWTGGLFLVAGWIADYVGINVLRLWDNSRSLLPELAGIPVGNIPFCFFGGALFILIWHRFHDFVQRLFFALTVAGTCAYFVALTIRSGFLIHYEPYSIVWAYFFWLGFVGFMILTDALYPRFLRSVGRSRS